MSLTRKMDRRRFRIGTTDPNLTEVVLYFVEYLPSVLPCRVAKYLWKDGSISQGVKGDATWSTPLLSWPGYYETEAAAEESITSFLKKESKNAN